MSRTLVYGVCLFSTVVAGCAPIALRDLPPERVYLHDNNANRPSVADGSIFSKAGQGGLTGTYLARQVGDLVTVLLEEQMSASTSASSNASRNSATTALTTGALASLDSKLSRAGVPWPADINPGKSAIDSSGQGSAEQQGRITGEVTAVVTEVLPNGILVVRGYKRMELARGTQVIRVTGLVRPTDIQPDNTIRSRRLADADIAVASRGELADASRAGWMNRALLRLWPF